MRRLAIVPLVACLLLNCEANAALTIESRKAIKWYSVKGEDLLRSCKVFIKLLDEGISSRDTTEHMHCKWFVLGVFTGVAAGSVYAANKVYGDTSKAKSLIPYCMPAEVGLKQTVRVVVKYLEDNPKSLQLASPSLVVQALIKAFPCK